MAYPTSQLGHENVLRDVHDPVTQTLRTTATAIIAPGLDVDISHIDDSIRLGNGTNFLTSTTDAGKVALDVSLINASLNVIVQNGTLKNIYNEVLSVANNVLTIITSYTVINPGSLVSIDSSGTNIAEYRVYLNGGVISKKRTYFGDDLNASFSFDIGLNVTPGDVIQLRVIHLRPSLGDFNANIKITES